MFNNISKEILYYSVIPVAIVAVIILLLLIIGKKRGNTYYKYNYFIKVLLIILLSFMLSIMVGYTVWVFERVINLGIMSKNILYIILLVVIDLAFFLSLIIMLVKLHKKMGLDDEKKELQNE